MIRAMPNNVSPRRTIAVCPGLATEVRGVVEVDVPELPPEGFTTVAVPHAANETTARTASALPKPLPNINAFMRI